MLIKLNILAYTTHEATARDLGTLLAGVEGMALQQRPAAGELTVALDAANSADVVILESDGSDLDLAQRVEAFVGSMPEGVVAFVIGDAANAALLRRLMRAGVRDVLAKPLVRQDVLNALTAVLSEKRARAMAAGESVTSVAAFFNAKGGCGATMLAVNTAASLASRQKARVALLDFDLQFGDCALLLDLAPRNNMGDALRQAERIDGTLLRALMTEHSSGLHVLASPSSPAVSGNLSPQAVRAVIDAASAAYDVVIVDLPRTVEPWTLEAIKAATTTFLVVQNNLATIRDARLLLDHLPRAGIDARRVELVNNRAMAKVPSVSIEQLKETLKHDKAHRVRNDYVNAVAAEDQGMPVSKVAPRCGLAKDIDALADYLWQAHGHGQVKKEGLLDKLFHPKPAAGRKAAPAKSGK